ncbi:SagB/ThcOx family dehydrogenase [Methanolobus sp. ZRKC3]|uniref:SagB/ThcOx family dehydrogenase n=1 Tax=Methanolobus sp. ZRKC3 TaxID=3125786 RepID=UPI003254169B
MNEIGREFMEKTKFQYAERSDQSLGYPQPPLEKGAGGAEVIDLPEPAEVDVRKIDLREAIEGRSSFRDFSQEALSLGELSYLLWCTQGVRELMGNAATLRNVPSAGARHSIETYMLINNVEGLEEGLYLFLPIEHKLAKIKTGPVVAENIMAACLDQNFIGTSAVTFIWTAVIYRMKWRYGERGYRYINLDAGHVCQNLYLSTQSIDCGVCAIGAFFDDELNAVLGVDGEDEFAIYIATLGKK